jgi:hypothetical protein
MVKEEKIVHIHRFQDGGLNTFVYEDDDTAVSGIFPGLQIPLKAVFEE